MEEEVVKEVGVEVENPISDNIKHPTKKKNAAPRRQASRLRNAAANNAAIFPLLLIPSDVPGQWNCVDLPD